MSDYLRRVIRETAASMGPEVPRVKIGKKVDTSRDLGAEVAQEPDSSRDNLTHEAAIEYAKSKGLAAVVRQSNQLQLDIDAPYGTKCAYLNQRVLDVIQQRYTLRSSNSHPSKSGNTHVVLTFVEDIDDLEALVFQAALGSDPVRETLGVFRHHDKEPYTSMLFEIV